MKKLTISTFLFILLVFSAGCNRDEAKPEPKASKIISLPEQISASQQSADLEINQKQNDSYEKVIHAAHEALVAKYNIKVTTGEIQQFVDSYYGSKLSDAEFEEIKPSLDAQLLAMEAVVEKGETPEKAAEQYLKPLGLDKGMLPMLKQANKEQLEDMRRMIPASREDMFQKNIPGNRANVEMIKIAKIILPEEQRQGDFDQLSSNYERALWDYAKKNLLGKDPALDGVFAD